MKAVDLLGVIVATLVLLSACALLSGIAGCARECPAPRIQLIEFSQWDYACDPPGVTNPVTHECVYPPDADAGPMPAASGSAP